MFFKSLIFYKAEMIIIIIIIIMYLMSSTLEIACFIYYHWEESSKPTMIPLDMREKNLNPLMRATRVLAAHH